MYRVLAEVWGGPTGRRSSFCKDHDQILTFPTLQAAEEYARTQQHRTMSNPHRTANFRYTAVPV